MISWFSKSGISVERIVRGIVPLQNPIRGNPSREPSDQDCRRGSHLSYSSGSVPTDSMSILSTRVFGDKVSSLTSQL
jgi:hypothetical protein